MHLWEIVLAVQSLQSQLDTLSATLQASLAEYDTHCEARQAEMANAQAVSEGPF
jgi:hypothetical protein